MNEPQGAAHSKHEGGCCHTASADALEPAIDPVCGMTVDPAKTARHASHGGTDYHSCSAGCLAKFTADPARYLTVAPRADPIAAPGGCCQSNRNSSPIGGALASSARAQAMRDCHSASAAERRSL